jgi:hypothetical protein
MSSLWSNNFSNFLHFGVNDVPFSALPILASSHLSLPRNWPESVRLVNRVLFGRATQEELERLAETHVVMFRQWDGSGVGSFRFPPGFERDFVGGLLSPNVRGDLPEFWQEKILITEKSWLPKSCSLEHSLLKLNRSIQKLGDERMLRVGPDEFRKLVENKIRRQNQIASESVFDSRARIDAQRAHLMRYLKKVFFNLLTSNLT